MALLRLRDAREAPKAYQRVFLFVSFEGGVPFLPESAKRCQYYFGIFLTMNGRGPIALLPRMINRENPRSGGADHLQCGLVEFCGAQAASPPQDGFAAANLSSSAACRRQPPCAVTETSATSARTLFGRLPKSTGWQPVLPASLTLPPALRRASLTLPPALRRRARRRRRTRPRCRATRRYSSRRGCSRSGGCWCCSSSWRYGRSCRGC